MTAALERMDLRPEHLVHNSVYSEACFKAELEKIFDRVWNFVCHESEVEATGDYMAKTIAMNPVIIVRGKDGVVRGFHNVCRHRGCQVVANGAGHSRGFLCPYHNWGYAIDGTLYSLPGEEAYEGTGLCKSDLGLVPVRTETLFGLVFTCFSNEPPSLEEYLGREFIEALRIPLGIGEYEVHSQRSLEVRGNWKLFPENGRDGYHVPFVHPFYRGASPAQEYQLYKGGHSIQRMGMAKEPQTIERWDDYMSNPLAGVEPGQGYVVHVWPDLVIHFRSNVVAIDSQAHVSWDTTLLEGRVLTLKGDTEEIRAKRLVTWKDWVDDRLSQEDMPVLAQQQKGLMSRSVQWSVVARGKEATTGLRGDDNRLRQFWEPWRRMMGVQTNEFPTADYR
jgi:phenylpropionate dioxygenase-like ring-hydroxylating dioxygenase large terminal subunit